MLCKIPKEAISWKGVSHKDEAHLTDLPPAFNAILLNKNNFQIIFDKTGPDDSQTMCRK